jgi:hypothetical protein
MRDQVSVLRARSLQLAVGFSLCACSGGGEDSTPRLAPVHVDAGADASAPPDVRVPPEKRWPAEEDAGRAATDQAADSGVDLDGADSGAPVEGEPLAPVDCDVTAPTACSDPPLRYADVEPIFADRCTGCHNGSDGRWPLTTYQHVADWYAEIRGQMLSCTMPPLGSGVAMTLEERERILLWIRCGFPR